MKKLLLLFSHKLTANQIKEAKKDLKVDKIEYLPKELQKIWSNVNPEVKEVDKLEKIKKYINKKLTKGDYVLVQGEWGFTYNMVDFAKKQKLIPIYSASKRNSKEYKKEGKIIKNSVFTHIKYKKY